ncbi:BamA/TamA family outer membrane protein [Myxococcota bacterium]|nr:BamA/TamA family outer membrane protein [Myxococcota bacterium]
MTAPPARALESELCEGPACAARVPRIRTIRFEGPGAGATTTLRARTGFAIDQPANDEVLIRIVMAVGELPGVGGVSVRLGRADRDGETVDVTLTADGRPRRVSTVGLTTRAEGEPEADENWRLSRQVQAEERAFLLSAGRPLHPFYLQRDEDMLRRAWQRRGHRDVSVRTELAQAGELVSVVFRVSPGPRYTVSRVEIDGPRVESDAQREALVERLATRADDDAPLVPWHLSKDLAAIRAHYCARGYADARVDVVSQSGPESRVAVTYKVTPGPPATVGAVSIEGFALPAATQKELPLRAGGAYCPDLLVRTEAAVMRWMSNHGHPDARVELAATPVATPAGAPRRFDVGVRITADTVVKVTRIWFEGNRNTREDVLRQLLAVEEGRLYRERDLEVSVQNLLRSGLFRQADVQTVSGAHPSERYLIFTVTEQDPVSIDLLEQSLTLRNLDLANWPADFDELSAGSSFRGAGQEVRFVGRADEIGMRFRHLFLHRYLLAETEFAWHARAVGPVEEEWLEASVGIGTKVLENRLSLLPFLRLEATDLPRRAVFDPLPVAQGSTVDVEAGAIGRAEFNRRDAERIPYLGVDANVRYGHGLKSLGGDLDAATLDVRAALNLPLAENPVGAHYVLRLAGHYGHLWTDDPVPAHRRLTPTIRGYAGDAIAIPFADARGENDGRLGGARSLSTAAELRIPIRPLRRNAFAPFIDAASVAAEGEALFDRLHLAAGASYYFSFFSERLEGFVYGAVPFESETEWQLVGAGVGGSF